MSDQSPGLIIYYAEHGSTTDPHWGMGRNGCVQPIDNTSLYFTFIILQI